MRDDLQALDNRSALIPQPSSLVSSMTEPTQEITLLETLDHLLDRGVVIAGEATISVGDVDLLYLGLNIVLANIDALVRTTKP